MRVRLRLRPAAATDGFLRIVFLASPQELRDIYTLMADFTADYPAVERRGRPPCPRGSASVIGRDPFRHSGGPRRAQRVAEDRSVRADLCLVTAADREPSPRVPKVMERQVGVSAVAVIIALSDSAGPFWV